MEFKLEDEYPTFASFLYKTRLNWIKHVIPVSIFFEPLGVFLEAYITAPVNPDTESKEDDEEDSDELPEISETKPAIVRLAYISQFVSTELKVPVTHLYPSVRNLTVISKTSKETAGEIELQPLYPDFIKKFRAKDVIDINCLHATCKMFHDISWTELEMAAILNRETVDKELSNVITDNFIKGENRICKISGLDSPTYSLKKEKPRKITDMTYKLAHTIDELYDNYKDCTSCELGVARKARNCKIVPSRGNKVSPTYFIIGEAPGGQEEIDGIPFNPNAPSGSILAKVLSEASIPESEIYITNAVICRPEQEEGKPGLNGKPKNLHITICNSRLKNEIAILKPAVVVLLGKTAFRSFYGFDPVNVVGSTGVVTCDNYKVYFVPHPSFIHRQLMMSKGEEKERIKQEYINHFKTIKSLI